MNETIKADVLKNAVAFSISFSRWGNIKRADKQAIETRADKDMIRMSKKLIASKEYDDVVRHQTKTRKWIEDRAVPSFFHRGVFLFRQNMVTKVDEYLEEARKVQGELIDKLVAAYKDQVKEAKEKLTDEQFNVSDYPDPNFLARRFGIYHKWLKFDLPDLPDEIFQKEKVKAEKAWSSATKKIENCLCESLLKLVKHATSRLAIKDGEKPKIFRDSLINNINDFLSTFANRNITNSEELEKLVDQTRNIVGSTSTKALRTDVSSRQLVASEFKKIENKLDAMVIVKPSRKFMDEDEL